MSQSRPKKRPRPDRNFADYDTVSVDDGFEQIHSREGRLKRVGNGTRTAVLPRAMVAALPTSWATLAAWKPPDDYEYALDPNDDLFKKLLDSDVMQEIPKPKTKKKKSKVSKRPHVVWMELHRQTYLDEMLRWAGRADAPTSNSCPDCLSRSVHPIGVAEYRCEECFSIDLVCAACCVQRHQSNPFHRIEKWSGARFIRVSLKSLGLKIQLNHVSSSCDNPIPCHGSLLVLHTNGIHEVAIQYCGCSQAQAQHIQLLRRRLYPSTQLVVKTCVTFELLRHLHFLSLTTKASTYDFYRALEKATNNTGVAVPKSRYRPLLRTVLQWRHLKMLKRGGRGHDPTGVAGTKSGELGIQCPSCPWPDINLSEDWRLVPDSMRFLYMMTLCMDANFRLKNQLVSNYSQDPGLGIGWAYMVPRKPYERHLLSQANEADVSTCVGFQALAKANTKYSVGLRYTGVNAVVCGRSEMVMPVGVGNLPKGERYSCMDYIFGSVLQYVMVSMVLISYDITCQWFVNLFKRMKEDWPDEIKTRRPITFVPAIPKLHYSMHEEAGHHVYSLNYIPGAGLSDCECPERVWAPHNALGNSTKTQAPGSRQDVLDDHFGFWNWLKYVGMGSTLSRKYRAAVAERNIQTEGHRGLTEVLDAKVVQRWEAMCEEWEMDAYPKTKKDPYHVEEGTISEARVKKELAKEEETRLSSGGRPLHSTSAASFIGLGLEIEETQRRIQRLASGAALHVSDTRDGNLTEQRNTLRTRLRIWEQLLPIYMPGLLQYLADRPDPEPASTATFENASPAGQTATKRSPHPEDIDIWLPSRIPAHERNEICRKHLQGIEERLREGQCHDALESLRQVLRLKSRMVQFKNKNVRGQREGTRSRAVIDRVHERAKVSAAKYRAARNALLTLRGPGTWENTLKVLNDGDVRGYQDPDRLRPRNGRQGIWEDDENPSDATVGQESELSLFNEVRSRRDGTGETRRTLSWIWINARKPSKNDEQDDVLRSEWAKSRARGERAKEEVMLLKEEMQRVLKYLAWKAEWWRSRSGIRSGVTEALAEGLQAFALTQADVQDLLADHFRRLWETPLRPSPDETATSATGGSKTHEDEMAVSDDDRDRGNKDRSRQAPGDKPVSEEPVGEEAVDDRPIGNERGGDGEESDYEESDEEGSEEEGEAEPYDDEDDDPIFP